MPRGAVMSSAVEVSVGSQSKTTPAPVPMTTVDPATAPARTSCVLDAELREPVGEEADGLVVREVGLLHPALGLRAEHAVERAVAAALGAHREPGVVDGLRAHDDALGCRRGGGCDARLVDELAEREAELAQALVAHGRDLEHAVAARLELGAHEVGELASLGHVDLVERDELRTLEQRHLALGHRVGGELARG